MFLQTVIEVLF